MTNTHTPEELINLAAQAALLKDGTDPVALDVRERFPFADAFLIVTGAVERTVLAIADGVEEALLEAGEKCRRREGRETGRWVLLDFDDLVVHIFHEEDRDFYEIERLWKDSPTIPLKEEILNLQAK